MLRSHAPLIGRQRERALLSGAWEEAEGGHPAVVLVTGEPGIGKTRLLEDLAVRAAQESALVLRGGASEAEGMPPYLPFLEAFGPYIRAAPPDVLRAQVGPMAPVLVTIFPELSVALGDLPQTYPLPAEQSRLRLFEAVGSFLCAIADVQPVLLLLDDLQWIDTVSVDLLTYVVRHQPSARLLVLGAQREGGTESNPALARAVAELNRLRLLETIAIGPLAAEVVTALASDLLGAPADPAIGRLLFAQSEGNPFFAEELIRVWVETGALVHDDAGWTLGTTTLPSLPPGLASAVRARLAHLPPDVREILRAAAIIGRRFDPWLLADAAGLEPESVEQHLHHATTAVLVRLIEPDLYAFSHDKIRECLYQELSTLQRRRLHGFIGRVLETQNEPGSVQRLAELAFHFAGSGDRERGATYAQLAAEHALATYAFEEATSHFQTALDLIDVSDTRSGELLLGLGEAALLTGEERASVHAFNSARTWFLQTGNLTQAGHAAHRLGQAWWRQEAVAEARAAFEDGLAHLKDHPGPVLVRILVDLATLLEVNLAEQAAAREHGRWALEMAEQLDDRTLIAAASRSLGNILVRSNDLDAGIAVLERALSLAVEENDPAEGAETCAALAAAYFWRGDIRRSHAAMLQRLDFALRSRDPYELRHVYTWLAVVPAVQGNREEAERLLEVAQAAVENLASPEPLAWLEFGRGAMASQWGDHAAAEKWIQRSIRAFRRLGPSALIWYLGQACVIRAHTRPVETAGLMDELETLLTAIPEGTMPQSEPLACLAQAALLVGDRERCRRYYPQLLPFSGQYHDMVVDRLLGEIETLQGNLPAAHSHLTAAEEMAHREELVWDLALTLEAQADLAVASDRREGTAHARPLLERSREIYQRQGNETEARRVEERLRSLKRPRTGLPANLTEREAEVLRLVTAGKSNRQIAAELVVSEKTVENHLTHIYNKLGIDNRAAATAFAIRHGIA
jgi:predicted ATPase/DNA-binding CsgD family transcriptional regulator